MAYTFNWATKTITLTSWTVSMSVRDLWSRWADWHAISDNSKYLPAFEQVWWNDIDVSAWTYIPIYAFLKNGWKLKPQESNHTLNVNDWILLVDGWWDPFINTIWNFVIRINYSQPVQAITVATWWSSWWWLTPEQETALNNTLKKDDIFLNTGKIIISL